MIKISRSEIAFRFYRVGTRLPRGAGEGLSARSMPRRYLERPESVSDDEVSENGGDFRLTMYLSDFKS